MTADQSDTTCPVCAGLGLTLYYGSGDYAEVRSCSECGSGLPIAPSEVPTVWGPDEDTE